MTSFIDQHTSNVTLKDGTVVTVRPIAPSDGAALQQAFHGLSEASRYMRFLRSMDDLNASEIKYLTEIDYHDHFAWVAVFDGEGIGVARYIRSTEDPATAEAAVVVADAWQRRGIATVLLTLLGESAWARGIRHFSALISAENTVVTEGLREIGANLVPDDSTMAMSVDLPFPSEAVGDSTLLQALRAVAKGLPG